MIISSKQVGEVLKIQKELRPKEQGQDSMLHSPLRGKDEVTLSSRAAEVSRVRNYLVTEVPEVRSERVKEISQALERGEYQVSPQEVADKMVGRLLADRLK